jgi:adenylosuccinate synthase
MAVTVVVGGQFGSEGKGKVAQFLAATRAAAAAVRVGGSNSGHTGIDARGEPSVLRQLPTAALLPDVACVLGPGSYIDVDLLMTEIRRTGLSQDRLLIDPNAFVITKHDREQEANCELTALIGSTASGTGASVVRRALRHDVFGRAATTRALTPFVTDTAIWLRQVLDRGERIVVEGTQGFGLSVLHTPCYPFATSRDTTASGAIAEAGLSPRDVDEIFLVLRTYPIRVGGHSGPLFDETDWQTVTQEAGYFTPLEEYTSVTGKVRRVGRFDAELVRKAVAINQPTSLVLNHVDYLDAQCAASRTVTPKAWQRIRQIEGAISRPIDYFGISRDPWFVARSPSYELAAVT